MSHTQLTRSVIVAAHTRRGRDVVKKDVYAPTDDMPRLAELPYADSGDGRVYRLDVDGGELLMLNRPRMGAKVGPMALLFARPSDTNTDVTSLAAVQEFLLNKLPRRLQVKDFMRRVSNEMQAEIDLSLMSLLVEEGHERSGADEQQESQPPIKEGPPTEEEPLKMAHAGSKIQSRYEHTMERIAALANESLCVTKEEGQAKREHIDELVLLVSLIGDNSITPEEENND